MRKIICLLVSSLMMIFIIGCVSSPKEAALNVSEFNAQLSGCFIADNYLKAECKVSKSAEIAQMNN